MYKIMTAGPSQVRENVRMARALETTNPDIDVDFVEYYKSLCDKLQAMVNSTGTAYILGGEGILGLEAACASLTEPSDRVLVLDNGVFGHGFADFVTMYGGQPVFFESDYKKAISADELRAFLEKDSDFKYATVVHCDTPSGMLNPIDEICPVLAEYGILTVVDSVAGMFGEPVDVDGSQIDILCGGSQKCMSAPPGLTMVWVSDKAMEAILARKTPIRSFYANLLTFRTYYEDKWFPYTMPISDINGLGVAIDNILADPDIYDRHAKIASATRQAVTEAGLTMYADGAYSNTVTAIEVPEGTTDKAILKVLKEKYGIMISSSFDVFAGKLIRIGHMGESANAADTRQTLAALDDAFAMEGISLKCSLAAAFDKAL